MAAAYQIFPISVPTPFAVGPANCYLVATDPPVLIDTGPRTDESYDALTRELGRQGYCLGDVAAVMVTHGHIDHVGQLGRILNESKATAYAHPAAVEGWGAYDVEGEETQRFWAGLFRESGVPDDIAEAAAAYREKYRAYGEPARIDTAVQDGQMAAGPFRVVYVPGHSASCVLYLDAARGVVFTGDHLLKTASSFPLLRRPRSGEGRPKCLVDLESSLRKTRDLDSTLAFPGHGKPFAHVADVVDKALERYERKTRHVLGHLAAGPATAYAVCGALFPQADKRTLHFALSAVIGCLDVLETRGAVRVEDLDGVRMYGANHSAGA